jgi:hypothetical protein
MLSYRGRDAKAKPITLRVYCDEESPTTGRGPWLISSRFALRARYSSYVSLQLKFCKWRQASKYKVTQIQCEATNLLIKLTTVVHSTRLLAHLGLLSRN